MQSDPKRSKDVVDPLREQVHDPDERPAEKTDEEGEPFDGNFA